MRVQVHLLHHPAKIKTCLLQVTGFKKFPFSVVNTGLLLMLNLISTYEIDFLSWFSPMIVCKGKNPKSHSTALLNMAKP
jgi:hypothetical protein